MVPIYGVDTRIFAPPTVSKAEIRRRLGLPETGSLVFFSSRIAPEKDSETLLAAVRRVLDDGHDLWILHRSGGYQEFLKDAAQYGVRDRVIATDAVHPHRDLPLDYQAVDVCIQASREEGLGFSPLEALASGIPVIATAVGGLRETIVDGETGWTYSVGDVEALAGRIVTVLREPEEAARRAARGREMVVARYDSRLVFERVYELLAPVG
jgi:glycosyltransferase involved in cell wall biosynthesis